MRRILGLSLVACLFIATACAEPPSQDLVAPPEPVHENGEAVTYTEHLRPLLAERCVGCHHEGGAAPFDLGDYEAAKPWAAAMASAVRDRRMPPYLADASGDCQTFRDRPWLNEAEIGLFETWAETGALQGDPSIPAPEPRQPPTLSGELHSVDIGAQYLPDQAKTDDYRCFVVESPGDFGVAGFNVVPGNPRIVHHLIAYQAADDAAAAEARRLDAESPEAGYDCLGTGPIVDVTGLAGWAPGQGAEIFPPGMGVEIAADRPIIIEMHYNIAGGPGQTDRTALELQTAPAGTLTPIIELAAIDYSFSGEPGQSAFVTSDDLPVGWQTEGQGTLHLLSANAHMHRRGVSQRLEVVRANGEVECLLDIPRWDYNWQLSYWYDIPIDISTDDTLRITCTFDTTDATEAVTWGDGTGDEMCLGSFMAVFENNP